MTIPAPEFIRDAVIEILLTRDLNKTTLLKVMEMLADHFNVSKEEIISRKGLIRGAIYDFLDIWDDLTLMEDPRVERAGDVKITNPAYAHSASAGDPRPSTPRTDDFENGVEKLDRGADKKEKVGHINGKAGDVLKCPAMLRPMALSDALTKICGEPHLPICDVIKKIKAYIRDNKLQDPKDATMILCDWKLNAIFQGNESVYYVDILQLLNDHIAPID